MNKVSSEELVHLYNSGMTTEEVARSVGISTGKTYYLLKEAGCVFRPRMPKGFVMPREAVEKIAASHRGMKLSEETKKRMSEARKSHFNGLNGFGHKKAHASGYVLVYVPDHTRAHIDGYVMFHTVIMERSLGRYLNDNEVVHHINHDHSDNRVENLVLMDKHEHLSMHMLERY